MPRSPRSPRGRSNRSESLHTLDACSIRSKDAVVANLAVQHLASPRLDAIESSARHKLHTVNAELQALKSRVLALEGLLQFNAVEGQAQGQAQQAVISRAPLVIREDPVVEH